MNGVPLASASGRTPRTPSQIPAGTNQAPLTGTSNIGSNLSQSAGNKPFSKFLAFKDHEISAEGLKVGNVTIKKQGTNYTVEGMTPNQTITYTNRNQLNTALQTHFNTADNQISLLGTSISPTQMKVLEKKLIGKDI